MNDRMQLIEERLAFLEDDREKADARITALELQVHKLINQNNEL